ncbi:Acyl transferase [Trinorchestia longiramus]|nr:Acyl transferase [Trinorchestia longiramus]
MFGMNVMAWNGEDLQKLEVLQNRLPLFCTLHYQLPLSCTLHYQLPLSCTLHYQLPLSCTLHYQLLLSCTTSSHCPALPAPTVLCTALIGMSELIGSVCSLPAHQHSQVSVVRGNVAQLGRHSMHTSSLAASKRGSVQGNCLMHQSFFSTAGGSGDGGRDTQQQSSLTSSSSDDASIILFPGQGTQYVVLVVWLCTAMLVVWLCAAMLVVWLCAAMLVVWLCAAMLWWTLVCVSLTLSPCTVGSGHLKVLTIILCAGMGRALLDRPPVQEMFRSASEILKFDLQKACLLGPADFLSRTQVQQPAILVCSLAALHKLQSDSPAVAERCVAAAGFSVGEITALTFSEVLSFEDAVKLIKVRSEAMQQASEQTPGGLATVFTGPDSDLETCIQAAKQFCISNSVPFAECKLANHLGPNCKVVGGSEQVSTSCSNHLGPNCKVVGGSEQVSTSCSNHLGPNCKVVGGSEQALQFISDKMTDFKLKRVKRINVSGAFHTEHMKPAAAALQQVLQDMPLKMPQVPVYANIDGAPYEDPEHIRRYLPQQIYSSVLWEQTLRTLYEGRPEGHVPRIFECGPGQSLKAINKMVNQKALANTFNIEA